jgi:hypothetical protein
VLRIQADIAIAAPHSMRKSRTWAMTNELINPGRVIEVNNMMRLGV